MIEQAGGFAAFVRDYGLGGILLALFAQIIDGINSAGNLLLGPPRALGNGLIDLTRSLINGLIGVFDAGTQTTILSYTDGVTSLLGPLAQPASVGTIMLTFAVFMYGINRLEISPLSYLQSIRS